MNLRKNKVSSQIGPQLRPRGLKKIVKKKLTNSEVAKQIIKQMYNARVKVLGNVIRGDDYKQLQRNVYEQTKHLVTKDTALAMLARKPHTGRNDTPNAPSETNSAVSSFFEIAKKLRVLARDHQPDEEAKQYDEFVAAITPHNIEMKRRQDFRYYESQYAMWYPYWLRFKNRTEKAGTMVCTKQAWYWHNVNLSVLTVEKQLCALLQETEKSNKPIVFLHGGQLHHAKKNIGHAVAIIIFRDDEGPYAILKDCRDVKEVKIPEMVKKVLLKAKVNRILPVGELESEELVVHSECTKECYKSVARILDGNFYKKNELTGRTSGWYDLKKKSKLVGPGPIPIEEPSYNFIDLKVKLEKLKI